MKSSRKLRLRAEARIDLREIRRYTARLWGPDQRDRYYARLQQALRSLREYPERGPARDEYIAGCRTTAVEQHVVFYYLTDDEVVIVRILHRNQDATGKLVP